jgi:hypothetical protein
VCRVTGRKRNKPNTWKLWCETDNTLQDADLVEGQYGNNPDAGHTWLFVRPAAVDASSSEVEADDAGPAFLNAGFVTLVDAEDKTPYTGWYEEVSVGDRVAVYWSDAGTGSGEGGWFPAVVKARPAMNAPSMRAQRGAYKCRVIYDGTDEDTDDDEETHTLSPELYLTSSTMKGRPKIDGAWVKLTPLGEDGGGVS